MSRTMLRRQAVEGEQLPAPFGEPGMGVEHAPVAGERVSVQRAFGCQQARVRAGVDAEPSLVHVCEYLGLEDMDAGEHQRCQRLRAGRRLAEEPPDAVA